MMSGLRVFFFFFLGLGAQGQELSEVHIQGMEQQTSANENEAPDEEDRLLDTDQLLRWRLSINHVEPEALGIALDLSPLQVRQFDAYRRLRGPFIDLMELQAVPGWDEATVRRVLPFLRLSADQNILPMLRERWRKGTHLSLLRSGINVGGGSDSRSVAATSAGGSGRFLFRYGYAFRNLLQWGFTAEKDPGEPVWTNNGSRGPDFLSWHFSLRDYKQVRALVIGDYQVNLGQGLIHWQSLAFKKGADALQVLRQAAVLRPYKGSDENRFHRGVGLQLQHRFWELLLFGALDRMDGNLVTDTLVHPSPFIRSIQTTGWHRTDAERADKDALEQRLIGASLRYARPGFRVSLNGMRYVFPRPIFREPAPYNLFAVGGSHWSNYSIDHAFTVRQVHFFGEIAIDQQRDPAILQGLLTSVHPAVDLALVYRRISPAYRSLQGNAFTENAAPENERGLYAGLTLRPAPGWRVDAHVDIFRFPWLRYRVHAPTDGFSQSLLVTWRPDKKTELFLRWQQEDKPLNVSVTDGNRYHPATFRRKGLRWQLSMQPTAGWVARVRAECGWLFHEGRQERSFLAFLDLSHKPMGKPYSFTARWCSFETDGYDSRLYAYEHDLPFAGSVSMLYGKGQRLYLIAGYKTRDRWHFSAKAALRPVRDRPLEADFRGQVTYRFSH